MFTIRIVYTDNTTISRKFRKLETAKEWVHKVALNLEKTIDYIDSDGPTLEELECEPVVIYSFTSGAAFRETMPEPRFEEESKVEELPVPPESIQIVTHVLDTDVNVALRPINAMIDQIRHTQPLEQTITETVRKDCFECPVCKGTGIKTWTPVTGPNAGKQQSGSCFRCAAQYKTVPFKGKITSTDYRRNQEYDRKTKGLDVRFIIRSDKGINGEVGFCKVTEVFTPNKTILAEEVRQGDDIFVATTKGDFLKVKVDQVIHSQIQ